MRPRRRGWAAARGVVRTMSLNSRTRGRSIGVRMLLRASALGAMLAAYPIGVCAATAESPSPSIEERVQALAPDLEAYIAASMKGFDVPGLAIGIVAGDKLVYAKGFGIRSKGGAAVDT